MTIFEYLITRPLAYNGDDSIGHLISVAINVVFWAFVSGVLAWAIHHGWNLA